MSFTKYTIMFKKKNKKKSAILSPDQARAFYNSLVASAPMHLKFLSDDQRQKVLARLEKIFCSGEPVEVDLDHDLMFAQAFDEVLKEGNEENDPTDL